MIVSPEPRQGRVSQVALKVARWEARAWGHYLDYLALSDTPPDDRSEVESLALVAALDACEYCCRRLEAIARPRLADPAVRYDPPLTPGVHPLPENYVYDPPQVASEVARPDRTVRPARRVSGSATRARSGVSSYAVLTGLTAMVGLGVWRVAANVLRGE